MESEKTGGSCIGPQTRPMQSPRREAHDGVDLRTKVVVAGINKHL